MGNPDFSKFGVLARGRKELIAHREGKKLTRSQMCLAKCYECMGGYADGKYDCNIPKCPIYPLMPFQGKHPDGRKP